MNDLISRSALLDRLTAERFAHYHTMHTDTASLVQHDQEFNVCMGIVFDFPAVDAEVVRHGRWVLAIVDDDELMVTDVTGHWCNQCWKPGEKHFNYCPNCGAKMDAEVEG